MSNVEATMNNVQTTMSNVQIDFTKSGRRQFDKLNNSLGERAIRGFILLQELAEYIAAHENSGVHLDTICHEIRYEDGVYLLLMKCQGVWLITDIWYAEEPIGFKPILLWKRVKRGFVNVLCLIMIGWRDLSTRESMAVC